MESETRIGLECSTEEAPVFVKAVLEQMPEIYEYYDTGNKIIAKTGPRVSGWGEIITVTIVSDETKLQETTIAVTAENEVGVDFRSSPEKYKNMFINHLKNRQDSDNLQFDTTKEVNRVDDLYDGAKAAMLFITVFFHISLLPLFVPFSYSAGIAVTLLAGAVLFYYRVLR